MFGTVCIDRLRRVEQLPAPGGYAEVVDERDLLGGEAANTATALTQWGIPTILSGNRLGDGEDGQRLRQLVTEKGVPYQEAPLFADHGDAVAPVCDIYVTPDGERTMFGRGFRSAGADLDVAKLPFVPGAWFTAEPNMEGPSRMAVRAAQAAGMRAYLMDFLRPDDPIRPGDIWQSSTDWVGQRANIQRNVRWVRDFVSRTGAFAILSDGPNGFVAGGPEHTVRTYPPFPAPDVVDTTGAGDMFRAGVLRGLARGDSMAEALRFASAAGCLKCQYLGATTRVPTEDEIKRHIAENPDVAQAYG